MRITHDSTAPADAVWAVLTDLDRFAEAADITRIVRLDDGTGFGVGTKWRETRVMFGREATEDMWVTSIDPGRSYTVAAESHGARYTSTLGVEPVGTGSRLTMTFDATATTLPAKVMAATVGRLFQSATRKSLAKDLAAVAAAAEAGTAG